jgi:hypothetical protein
MIEEVKMNIDSITTLIEKYRDPNLADWSRHGLSKSCASEPWVCTDVQISNFIAALDKGCELYPVTLIATKLPDKRYFLEVRMEGAVSAEYVYAVQ